MSSSSHIRSAEDLLRKIHTTVNHADEQKEYRDHVKLSADEAVGGATLYQESLKENPIRDYFWKSKKNLILSEAKSEATMQELKADSADFPFRELSRHIQAHRMELYHANHVFENSRREEACLQAELENRERAHRETRMRTFQEVEESKKKDLLF